MWGVGFTLISMVLCWGLALYFIPELEEIEETNETENNTVENSVLDDEDIFMFFSS